MPRQNFLSRESFIESTEKQAKDTVLSVPAFASNIRLIAENKMIESMRFSYELPVKKTLFLIDVSVLPLNNKYTRICLHSRQTDGQAFHNNADMAIALHDFESAIMAALKGDVTLYKPYMPKVSNTKKFFQVATAFIATVGVLFLKKKLS
jgi:hypothetical protein